MKSLIKYGLLIAIGFVAIGCSKETVEASRVGVHNKVQLWEGGPYWADTNIGAERPWDYGCYFWWGDTVGYKRKKETWVASDGSSTNFSFIKDNIPTQGKDISTLRREGWITPAAVLAPEHDAAQVLWGGGWRMPTEQELEGLVKKCDWIRTRKRGVNGYLVRGRGVYAAYSIFLPAAGFGDETSLKNVGSDGMYWSSVPGADSSYTWDLHFISSFPGTYHSFYRFLGYPVRPVQGAPLESDAKDERNRTRN